MRLSKSKTPAVVAGAFLAWAAFATVPASAAQAVNHDFAQHRLVMQISDGSELAQKLVLNNVANVLKSYGVDMVHVEVVAFGPGIRLLLKNNVNSDTLKSLQEQGVEFAACGNTMHALHLTNADLNPAATPVPGGIVEIMTREEQGWSYIRP